jgi:histidine triad (HIT) family protein
MDTCVFCEITTGLSPARILYEDSLVIAFHDIHPLAPVHMLVVPRRHIPSLNQVGQEDEGLLGHMLLVAKQLAKREAIDQSGYRMVINTGFDGGQTVPHLHLHILGGRRIAYPLKDL